MKKLTYIFVLLILNASLFAKEYHVSSQGSDSNNGRSISPFKTINHAAQKALAGDTVTVHSGTYREWVNPLNGGDKYRQILYRAAEGEKVELKGSELIKSWKKEKRGKGVWSVTLPNTFFGSYNPYNDKIFGDWFRSHGRDHHTGEVYLNDVSFYESISLEKVFYPDTIRSVRDPEGSTSVWYAKVENCNTVLYANFGDANPNKESVEIAVRPTCFYPTAQGLNYITIRGFHVSQAATQWGAPTAEQVGMISTHWCKGWIIENNIINNSRCSGITLGKERATGHNLESTDLRLDGFMHYIEVIFNTLRNGWSRDNVGSHIVRNNVIFDCEQTAICGSMGGAFSEIYGNHIYNIWVKRQFSGAEMAGIKLHGAIDTYIHNNRIHNCGYGIWLDWMAQGSRISSNLMYKNTDQDIFMEVDHGPYIIDNNLLLSSHSILEYSDGGAYLHNLIAGNITRGDEPSRYTPYHLNHSSELKGISVIINGDHRFYNNIFLGRKNSKVKYGLCVYNDAKWPIYAAGNLFLNDAFPMTDKNQGKVITNFDPNFKIEETGDDVYISFDNDKSIMPALETKSIDSKCLGITKLTGLPFENADGTSFVVITDYLGNIRSSKSPLAGPFEKFETDRIKLW